MRSSEDYCVMRLRHFINNDGNKEKFINTVHVRGPYEWADHPKRLDILQTVKQIILDNWNTSSSECFTVCGIRTKLISHSAWEYWLIAVDEKDNDDDTMPLVLPEDATDGSSRSTPLIAQQEPLLMCETYSSTHNAVNIVPEVKREKEWQEEVASDAETVIIEHNMQSAVIKEEIDISDISDCETHYNPIVEDISEAEDDPSMLPSVTELKHQMKFEEWMNEDPFYVTIESDLVQNSPKIIEVIHLDDELEALDNSNIAATEDSVAWRIELMEGGASTDEPMYP